MENEKYQRAKIYKIVDNTNDNVYIGSTCEPTLARRLAKHRGNYNFYMNGKGFYVTSFKILENDNYDIILIENYPCNNKDELHARERYHIESNNCVNKNIPNRKIKEYNENNKEQIRANCKIYYENNTDKLLEKQKIHYENNKDQILEKRKVYYDTNKEKIKARQSAQYNCKCGKCISVSNKSNHEKSKFHQNFLNNL